MIGLEPIKFLALSLLSCFLYNIYIKCFRKLSQTERALGLASHKKKNGTITMGGIIFLVLPLFFIPYTLETTMIIFAALGFGILGLIDDLLIILLKKNDGLPAIFKLLVEIGIAGVIFFFYLKDSQNTEITLFNKADRKSVV